MNTAWKVLGAASGVAAIGFGVYVPLARMAEEPVVVASRKVAPQSVQEPRPMSAEEIVKTLLPALGGKDVSGKKEALDAISLAMLDSSEQKLSGEGQETVSRALIDAYSEATEETPEAAGVRSAALRLLMTQVGGDTARHFAADVMASGPDEMKLEAAKLLLEPGAIRGGDVTEKGLAIARSDAAPAELKAPLLRRLLGRKAEPELVALLDKETGSAALRACAVEIQSLDKPELMGKVLARLEEQGLLKDARTMPWFSGRMLSEHIRSADGDELARALRVVWLRPSLTRKTMKAVSADPQIRRMVARIVPDAVKNQGIEPGAGEDLLVARLAVETDPAVKGEIEGSLAQVRQTRLPEPAPQTVTQ